MRKVLIVGSIVCCIPALYLLVGIPYDIIIDLPSFLRDQTAHVAVIFYAVYISLAFAPAILLLRRGKAEMPSSTIVILGIMEFVAISVLVAGLAFWSGGV